MSWLEVLLEGASDVPTLKEVLHRKFGLQEGQDFRLHVHQGKGKLPLNPLSKPDPKHRGLLDQLPAKLGGYGKSLAHDGWVLVVLDADDAPCAQLLSDLNAMLASLPVKPQVMFRLAIEETESWFIADAAALEKAYPGQVKKAVLKNIKPDAIVGAWERLAESLKINPKEVSGAMKVEWAKNIAPHLDFDAPCSPSLAKLIQGLEKLMKARSL